MRWLWNKTKSLVKWIWSQLKDWRNLVIFIVVVLILSSEVWVMYLLGIITGNNWFYGIASACWLFWLGPFTPFIPLSIAITLGIRKLIDEIKTRRNKSNDSKQS